MKYEELAARVSLDSLKDLARLQMACELAAQTDPEGLYQASGGIACMKAIDAGEVEILRNLTMALLDDDDEALFSLLGARDEAVEILARHGINFAEALNSRKDEEDEDSDY